MPPARPPLPGQSPRPPIVQSRTNEPEEVDPESEPEAPAPAAPAPVEPAAEPELTAEAEEQILTAVRAALEATLLPLVEKQKELELRLEALQREAERAPPPTPPPTPAKAPESVAPQAAAPVPGRAAIAVASVPPPPAHVSLVPVHASVPPEPRRSVPPRASLIPTSYGYVIQPEAPPPRPAIEVALENVGPIELPDFGRRRRLVGRVLVGLLVAGFVAAIAATVLSYT